MTGIADQWWNEERRDMVQALEALVVDDPNPSKVGQSLDTILNDLELYDDPRQSLDRWLFDGEFQFATAFAEHLQSCVERGASQADVGATALASSAWPIVKGAALSLLNLMTRNGDFTK